MPPSPPPLHVLGGGSIGLLFSSYIRRKLPEYPVTLLLRNRPHHQRRLLPCCTTATSSLSAVSLSSSQISSHHDDGPKCIVAKLSSAFDNDQSSSSTLIKIPAEIMYDEDKNDSVEVDISTLILSTKAYDASLALDSVFHRLAPKAKVVILTNGALGVRDDIDRLLQEKMKGDIHGSSCVDVEIVLASTTHGAYRGVMASSPTSILANGIADDYKTIDESMLYHVVHAGAGTTYIHDQELASLFTHADLNGEYTSEDEMQALLWKKLAVNCIINPFTALWGCRNGDLIDLTQCSSSKCDYNLSNERRKTLQMDLESGDDTPLMQYILQEVSAVANAEAAELKRRRNLHTKRSSNKTQDDNDEFSHQNLQSFVNNIIRATAQNKSSMLQDVQAKQNTEISYLNGFVANKGKQYAIDTPVNTKITELVEELTLSYTV